MVVNFEIWFWIIAYAKDQQAMEKRSQMHLDKLHLDHSTCCKKLPEVFWDNWSIALELTAKLLATLTWNMDHIWMRDYIKLHTTWILMQLELPYRVLDQLDFAVTFPASWNRNKQSSVCGPTWLNRQAFLFKLIRDRQHHPYRLLGLLNLQQTQQLAAWQVLRIVDMV